MSYLIPYQMNPRLLTKEGMPLVPINLITELVVKKRYILLNYVLFYAYKLELTLMMQSYMSIKEKC